MWFRNKETRPPQAVGMQLGPRRHSGMPRRGRPGIREHRPGLTLSEGPCSWIPGSRAAPVLRNDDFSLRCSLV
jgi:hypothetical protein